MRILIGFLLCLFACVKCEIFSQCNDKPSRTYIANTQKKDNCRSFIFCNGENSFEDSCPEGLAFNPSELTCDAIENVECDFDEEEAGDIDESSEMEPVSSTIPPAISTKKPIVTVPTKKHPTPPGRPQKTPPSIKSTTSGKKNTNRPIPTRTNSPTRKSPATLSTKKSTVRPKTTSRVTVSTENNDAPVRIPTPPGGHNVPGQQEEPFPVMPDVSTKLPTERTTNTPSQLKSSTLSASTTPQTDSMENPEESSETTETVSDSDVREQCAKKTVGSFAYPGNCHFYYRCIRGVLHKQECPRGFGWDANSKMCTSKGCAK